MGSGTKPVINSWEATYLIRQGLSDPALMKRYSISAKGLESLFSKLVSAGDITLEELEKRSLRFLRTDAVDVVSSRSPRSFEKIAVNAAEAVECIRSGMTDQAVMEKYNLSTRGLNSLFKKLVSAGEIDQDELDARKNVLEWAEIAFVHVPQDDPSFEDPPRLWEVPEELLERQDLPQPKVQLGSTEEVLSSPFATAETRESGLKELLRKHKAVLAAGGGLLAGMLLLATAFSLITGTDYALEAALFWWKKPAEVQKVEDPLHVQAERTAKALRSIAREAPRVQEAGTSTGSQSVSYQECMKNCEDEVDMGDHLDRVLLMYCRRECGLRRNALASGIRKRYHQPAIQF
jgi:hypothetical protein